MKITHEQLVITTEYLNTIKKEAKLIYINYIILDMSVAIVKKDERSEVSSLSEAIMTAHNDNKNISIKRLNIYHNYTPIWGVTKIKK